MLSAKRKPPVELTVDHDSYEVRVVAHNVLLHSVVRAGGHRMQRPALLGSDIDDLAGPCGRQLAAAALSSNSLYRMVAAFLATDYAVALGQPSSRIPPLWRLRRVEITATLLVASVTRVAFEFHVGDCDYIDSGQNDHEN